MKPNSSVPRSSKLSLRVCRPIFPTRRVAVHAVAATVAALCLASCQKHEATDVRLEDPLIQLATVQPADLSNHAFTGVVSARVQSDLGFRVPGKVIERLVDTGVSVKAGQPLMRIDPTDLLHGITNQQGVVDAANAQAIQARADEARYRKLLDSGAISNQDYDHAKAAVDSAQSLLTAAQAQLQVAKDNAQYAELCADADGVIVETLVESGQVVAAGQTVIKLAHSGPREAAVNLPESLRPAMGSTALAALYNGETKTFPARLRQLSESADLLTRTFEARYVLEGEAAQAPLGATVTIYIRDYQTGSDIQVPVSAISNNGSGPGVWIFDTKTSSVHLRPVQVRQLGEENAVVSDGLRIGDQVVALGVNLLHENQKVRITEVQGGTK